MKRLSAEQKAYYDALVDKLNKKRRRYLRWTKYYLVFCALTWAINIAIAWIAYLDGKELYARLSAAAAIGACACFVIVYWCRSHPEVQPDA